MMKMIRDDLTVKGWSEDRWVINEQRRGTTKNLSISHAEHAPIILIFRLIERQKTVIGGSENGQVGRKRLSLPFVDCTHIDRKRKLGPWRLHFTVGKEESFDGPELLICKQSSPWHPLPLSEPGEKDDGPAQPNHNRMIRMDTCFSDTIDDTGAMFTYKPCNLQPDFHTVRQEAILEAKRYPLHT
jgi:hypothetical protein